MLKNIEQTQLCRLLRLFCYSLLFLLFFLYIFPLFELLYRDTMFREILSEHVSMTELTGSFVA